MRKLQGCPWLHAWIGFFPDLSHPAEIKGRVQQITYKIDLKNSLNNCNTLHLKHKMFKGIDCSQKRIY